MHNYKPKIYDHNDLSFSIRLLKSKQQLVSSLFSNLWNIKLWLNRSSAKNLPTHFSCLSNKPKHDYANVKAFAWDLDSSKKCWRFRQFGLDTYAHGRGLVFVWVFMVVCHSRVIEMIRWSLHIMHLYKFTSMILAQTSKEYYRCHNQKLNWGIVGQHM